jgi:hypothetical protein
MKNIFFLFLFFPCLFFSQIPDKNEQLKVVYSIDYKKIPFKMKMFKKHLPTEFTSYYSKLGSRNETTIDVKMMGEHMRSSSVFVENDSLNISWEKTLTIVNDSIVDNQLVETKDTSEQKETDVLLGTTQKTILGYSCISFSFENDSSKITGFIAPDINGKGQFQDHGLPLELTITSKKEKTTIVQTAQQISTEPLNPNMFFFKKK